MGQLLAGPFCGQLLGRLRGRGDQDRGPGPGRPDAPVGPGEAARPVAVVAGDRPQQEVGDPATCATPRARPWPAGCSAPPTSWSRTSGPGPWSGGGSATTRWPSGNPGLVLVRVTGFGQTGRTRRGPGTARSARPWAGCATSPASPRPPPSRAGISIGDSLAGDLRRPRGAAGPARPRAHRPRPGRRLGHLRGRAGDDGVAGHRVPGGRVHPRADRRDPAQRRPLQRVPDRRRPARAGRRQPGHRVPAPGRGDGPARAGRRPPLRHATRPAASTRPSWTG